MENVEDFNFQYFQAMGKYKNQISKYFQDKESSILNRGPYNSNFRTESIKIQLKIYNFI